MKNISNRAQLKIIKTQIQTIKINSKCTRKKAIQKFQIVF